jgi:putative DNA methylase
MTPKKKLIEVALPLEAINKASAREKSIRHGHPSTLHLWWARRPLAAARAVIFAQMVDDPSAYVDTLRADPKLRRKAETALKARLRLWEEARTLAAKAKGTSLSVPQPGHAPTLDEMLSDLERQRLFRIIEDLVLWENTTNEKVLQTARDEIWQSWRRACAENADHPRAKDLFDRKALPVFHDPFAGGGALPLEAQRLGLASHASDLNPVAVLINKAMIEIPPRFVGNSPVHPEAKKFHDLAGREWHGSQGLAEDVRLYGQWIRGEAEKRVGHLYPNVAVTPEMVKVRPDLKGYVGTSLTVIAWIWARTVKSPNPAFAKVDVPLVSNFMLSTKPGNEAHIEPVIEKDAYRFIVKIGKPKDMAIAKNGTKLSRGANFQCLMSGAPIAPDYIKAEGRAHRMGARLMAIVAEGPRSRVYLAPTAEHEQTARMARPEWIPDTALPDDARNFWTVNYGLTTYGDLFTLRQLAALTAFSDLVVGARERARLDAVAAGMTNDGKSLKDGGSGATAYGEAVGVYLAFAVDRVVDRHTSIATWDSSPTKLQLRNTFARQSIPMTWDFGEGNPFCMSSGTWTPSVDWVSRALTFLPATTMGTATQSDASTQTVLRDSVVSTDPPYYDNIAYADLSDFFYVWLRRSLRPIFPELFATVVVPKAEELVAAPYRHGGKESAEAFFLTGMTQAMHRLADSTHPGFPVTIYYAFKQAETDSDDGTTNTGWDTFLADPALEN